MPDAPDEYGAVEAGAPEAEQKPLGENPVVKVLQRPRIMLLLLAFWSIIGLLSHIFVRTGFVLDIPTVEDERVGLGGAMGGFALGWQSLPLAVLYLYCVRDPFRYQRIFWLALIHMGALIVAQFLHWLVTDAYSFGSIILPLAGSLGLAVLVFLHLFQPRDEEAME
jgi:hypothetical protein